MKDKSILDYDSVSEYLSTLDDKEIEELKLQRLVRECLEREENLNETREVNKISMQRYQSSLSQMREGLQDIAYYVTDINNSLMQTIEVAQATKTTMDTTSSSLEKIRQKVKDKKDRAEMKILEEMLFDGNCDA